ncbi:glycosyltransferase family 2 protein [Emticicia sp. TH156]|uniref:glycosyltransferase family 2 protein n=1 Tax=Emticicia sp. TH156 TaxID=2067454 RepID=UPI000C766CAE|nr:glycosyltransferase family 2 protein [Emticicia sp. TH156]PLK44030.1 glycosyltransferase [Emticicia sp. TH156]
MQDLKISIITPSYNQGRFIEETILSVLNQGYDNLEYIIMDGGSSDNTVEIIEKYKSGISFWKSEKDKGQTDAINQGFAMATGDIIAWINSDDVYCEGAFHTVADYFKNYPDCMWVAGSELFMNQEGQTYIRKHPNTSRWLEKNAMMSLYQPNVFLRRSVLTTIGFLREDFHMTMDLEWYSRIAQKYPVHIIDKDIAKFRWHTDSKSSQGMHTKAQKRYHEEVIIIIQQIHPNLKWITSNFPKTSLFFWFKIERFMRLSNRILKGELRKINDKL